MAVALLASGCGSSFPDQRFATLPPGAALPSGEDCAARVGQGHTEEVPENDRANHTVPDKVTMPVWGDYTERANKQLVSRIDGKFTGTTGEILAWGACKWGLDIDVLRAVAYQESSWKQSTLADESDDPADCVGGAQPPCPTSFGLMQLKHMHLPGSYPHSETSTAFNVDYYGARMRSCYEGWVDYFGTDYAPGDLWNCVGWHYSGSWKDAAAMAYVAGVQRHVRKAPWKEFEHASNTASDS